MSACPIFHHTHNGTWAHLTVVVEALAVARHLQKTAGIGVAGTMRELRGLQEDTISLNGRLPSDSSYSRSNRRRPQYPSRALKNAEISSKHQQPKTHRKVETSKIGP